MGAPKQRWTAEEEAALKAGIAKHGAGKWSTILRDPQFSCILRSRSNVDLKDKWRNICVMPFGRNFRDKAKSSLKKHRKTPKNHNKHRALTIVEDSEEETDDGVEPLQIITPNISDAKLKIENLILEALINLKEPTGSNKAAIATYIEELDVLPSNFKVELSERLKRMTESGKLIKVKLNYRIAPTSKTAKALHNEPYKTESDNTKKLSKPEIDAELTRMSLMTLEEATAAAALLVAEAEFAINEASEAMRLAEAAEADAEAAQALAESAALSLKNRNATTLVPYLA